MSNTAASYFASGIGLFRTSNTAGPPMTAYHVVDVSFPFVERIRFTPLPFLRPPNESFDPFSTKEVLIGAAFQRLLRSCPLSPSIPLFPRK